MSNLATDLAAPPPETQHFNIGNGVDAFSLGTADVFTPAAAAYFGRLNQATRKRIKWCHLHLEVGGASGDLTAEIWRERAGVHAKLCDMTLSGAQSDNAKATGIPAGALAELEPGDYLKAQVTAVTHISAGNGDGVTLDIHYY